MRQITTQNNLEHVTCLTLLGQINKQEKNIFLYFFLKIPIAKNFVKICMYFFLYFMPVLYSV